MRQTSPGEKKVNMKVVKNNTGISDKLIKNIVKNLVVKDIKKLKNACLLYQKNQTDICAFLSQEAHNAGKTNTEMVMGLDFLDDDLEGNIRHVMSIRRVICGQFNVRTASRNGLIIADALVWFVVKKLVRAIIDGQILIKI